MSLIAEEAAGGHTIAKHVGRTDTQLVGRVRVGHVFASGPGFGMRRASTFRNIQSAEALVNSVLAQNSCDVQLVAMGWQTKGC
ncbi:MAG: hypothetical protein HZY74_08915 [Brevundimonas sp.]|nr:MAG: hypothetical protein HZY74_08915 [Brevundimonas sp.]